MRTAPPPTRAASPPDPGGPRSRAGPADAEARAKADFLAQSTRHPARLARKLRISTPDAEDLLQFAAIEFLTARVHPAAWWSWWRQVLWHRRCQLARAERRAQERAHELEAYQRDAPRTAHSAEAELCLREGLSWCMDQVAPDRREVVERILTTDDPYKQIADDLGLPLATVKSRWQRGVNEIREAVARRRPEERSVLKAALAALLLASLWLARHVRRRSGPLVACAALSIAVPGHVQRADRSAADSPHAAKTATEESLPHAPGRYMFTPYLSTWAERERDAPAAVPSGAAAREKQIETARRLLVRASAAILEGDAAVARGALQLYDTTFPEDPYPRQRAELAAALSRP